MLLSKKLVLGTAQFGSDYGIANKKGQPSKKEVFSILEKAWISGVRIFDTAPSYNTESILGEFIKVNGLSKKIKIITKVSSLDKNNFKKSILDCIKNSIRNLGCEIDTIFLHDPKDIISILNFQSFYTRLMDEFNIKKLGASIYDVEEAKELNKSSLKLAYQFPYSVLDRRFEKINISKGTIRYARSIFLQGVLASENPLNKKAPRSLKKIHFRYHSYLNNQKIDPLSFAISYVYFSKLIDFFLIGVDSLNQFNQIVNIRIENYVEENFNIFEDFTVEGKWLNPRIWI